MQCHNSSGFYHKTFPQNINLLLTMRNRKKKKINTLTWLNEHTVPYHTPS